MKKRDLVQFSDIPLLTANFGKLRKVVGCSVGQSEVDDFTEVVYRWPRFVMTILIKKSVGEVLTWGKSTNVRRLIIVMTAKRGYMVTLSSTPVVYAL